MKIEKMNIADLSQVETLYQAANLFAKKNYILNWTKDGLKKFPNLNLVYKKNKKIIGAISTILKTKNHAEINDIAVDKNNRGQGIGQKLIKKIIDDLKQIGVKKITLWVHWSNAQAIPFYYRLGFRITRFSRTKNIKGVPNGEDIIHLENNLQNNLYSNQSTTKKSLPQVPNSKNSDQIN